MKLTESLPVEEKERQDTERLKQEPTIQKSLQEQSESDVAVKWIFSGKNGWLLGVYVLVFFGAALFYQLVRRQVLEVSSTYEPLFQRLMISVMAATILLSTSMLVDVLVVQKVDSPTSRYNLSRILKLVTGLLLFILVVTLLYSNWYTTVVSLGLISLVLGLALQNPLTSFFAWIYILIRKPYQVGDRIKIGSSTGDVVSLGYLETTLWEFRGDYLSGDHPSGRIIRFSNSKVFDEYIINYSWPLFPYIWNELKFYVAYESDFDFIKERVRAVVKEDIGEEMMYRVRLFRNILKDTPVDEVEVREGASVSFQAHENTWIQVVVRYLVPPKESSRIKNRLFYKIMHTLREAPDKVLFPKTNMR
ncbi:mechanosensitive ion channel family protein [Telluribacter humicola]|uniref:mechanosensitive ion channel family protein n=1 Tax=Telluribacter humicola TaxID=1720261 RepID=UPI001A97441F|nr:mechanosensitive ion channel domain-containing protein [Telluribacter humicola]